MGLRARIGAFVAIGLLSLAAAAPAHGDLTKSQKKAIAKSNKTSPKVADGSLERRSAKRVTLTFDARLPDLDLDHEKSKVQVSVFKRRSDSDHAPLRTLQRRVAIPDDRKTTVRIQIRGKAGKVLARAIAKRQGGKRGPLNLVLIELKHARDLFGDESIDAVWHRNARGLDLVGGHGGGMSQEGASRGVGNILEAEFTLAVQTASTEVLEMSVGSLTCTQYAGALNAEPIGGSYPIVRSTNVKEAASKFVENWKGFASSPDTAATLPNPELRTFGYETALYYQKRLPLDLPPGLVDLRNRVTINNLPKTEVADETPCLNGTHTFAVAADGTQTGNHIAKLYQFKRAGTLSDRVDVFAFPDGTLDANGFGDDVTRNGNKWTVKIVNTGSAGYPTLSGPCPDAGHWMECKFPKGSALEKTPLYDVTIPGSHDSSTGALGLQLEESTAGSCSAGPGPADVLKNVPTVTRNWAVTQPLNLREQLEAGIRYLDMRAAFDGADWRPIHTLYSLDKLTDAVHMIANWAAQHPEEIVVVDFNHICVLNGGNLQAFENALKDPAPVTGHNLCDQAYEIIAPNQPVASDLASRTVADIRAGKGNLIVLLQALSFDGNVLAECGWAPQGAVDYSKPFPIGGTGSVPTYDAWPNQEGPPGQATKNSYGSCADPTEAQKRNENIKDYPYADDPTTTYNGPLITDYKNLGPVPLLQTQMIYTLDFGSPENAITSTNLVTNVFECPTSLLQWGNSLVEGGSPYTRADILANWGTQTNMVIADNVTQAYISQAVNLND